MKPVREKLGRIPLRGSEPQITYFDLEYMRRSVPIQRVTEQLGLRTAGNMIHCWRPENHQHGDRTVSVRLQPRRYIQSSRTAPATRYVERGAEKSRHIGFEGQVEVAFFPCPSVVATLAGCQLRLSLVRCLARGISRPAISSANRQPQWFAADQRPNDAGCGVAGMSMWCRLAKWQMSQDSSRNQGIRQVHLPAALAEWSTLSCEQNAAHNVLSFHSGGPNVIHWRVDE